VTNISPPLVPKPFGTPDFTFAGRAHVTYRVVLRGPLRTGAITEIEKESRGADGAAIVRAAALARWGARVRLEIHGVGDDPHGHFIEKELAGWPNLELVLIPEVGRSTPYAIVVQGSDGQFSVLTNHWVPEPAEGQSSGAACVPVLEDLLGGADLAWAVEQFAHWPGARLSNLTPDGVARVSSRLGRTYRENLGGIVSIPTREEFEAAFRFER